MKEVNSKGKLVNKLLPKHLNLSNMNIFDQKTIAEYLNKYFVNVGTKLSFEIPQSPRSSEIYVKGSDSSLEEVPLSDGETKKSIFFPGFGEINYDIVNQNFNFLLAPLKFIFDLSLKSGTFPEKMKITQFTPVFKSGYTSIMINYRSISLLPCLSKMLERIMYNRLYKYLIDIFFYYTAINLDFKRDTLQGMQFFSWLNK